MYSWLGDLSYNSTVLYIMLVLLLITTIIVYRWLGRSDDGELYQVIREAQLLPQEQKKRVFDYDVGDDNDQDHKNGRTERALFLSGSTPFVSRACDYQPVLCLTDSHCALLCQNASIKNYRCDQQKYLCVDHALPVNIDQADQISARHCNSRLGEYALLQGYNEVGSAQWQCIALYPGWSDYSRYCEGGQVELDVRRRPPSYHDCTCPEGTTRMVYRQSMLGQESNGLPHCIRFPKLYSLDYIAV